MNLLNCRVSVTKSCKPTETLMPHAIQIRQNGAGKMRINVYQCFALKDATDAHKALEARATYGSTILTI